MRYLIENARPRKLVTLFGKVLASAVSSRKNEPGQLWLTDEQFRGELVQGLIKSGKIRLKTSAQGEVAVERVRGITELVAMVDEVSNFGTPVEAVASAVAAVSIVEEVAPLQADSPVVVETASEPTPVDVVAPGRVYTEEELAALPLRDLRVVCVDLKLDPQGGKTTLIERILLSQVSP